MKKILTILSFIFLMFVGTITTQAQVITQNDLIEASKQVNSVCPFMVDAITRLDYTTIPGHFIIQYNYTLVTMLKSSLNVDVFKDAQEKTLITMVRNLEDLSTLRDNNITFQYSYYDKEHNLIAAFTISPDKYNLYY